MILMTKKEAKDTSLEIAKILCANSSSVFTLDSKGADQLADFIETLCNRLTNHTETPE